MLTTKGMREAGFPVKVSLPLYLGVFAVVTFDNCKIFKQGDLEPELFLVNPNYGSSRRMRKVCDPPGRAVVRTSRGDGTRSPSVKARPPCCESDASETSKPQAWISPRDVLPGRRPMSGKLCLGGGGWESRLWALRCGYTWLVFVASWGRGGCRKPHACTRCPLPSTSDRRKRSGMVSRSGRWTMSETIPGTGGPA